MRIQIKPENSVPGMGGLNFNYLRENGWNENMWLNVIEKTASGVYVRFPNFKFLSFIYNKEIVNIKD